MNNSNDERFSYVEKLDMEGAPTIALKLTVDPWVGIIYQYGRVHMQPVKDGEEDERKITYEYVIHDFPEAFDQNSIINNVPFHNLLGDICITLLERAAQEGLQRQVIVDAEHNQSN